MSLNRPVVRRGIALNDRFKTVDQARGVVSGGRIFFVGPPCNTTFQFSLDHDVTNFAFQTSSKVWNGDIVCSTTPSSKSRSRRTHWLFRE
ncbi:hypothetical protein L596_026561 [Steinernema carpocapsae]|uniref:Uncharacterized protein n=1 Tax=Steinernema carpocapsae TaxID=34508 RepID=A0A4U5M1W2_STECR|nr:hypothetical protein L596_026561 [Steinernema carpocapsae]